MQRRRKMTFHNLWSFLVLYLYWGILVLSADRAGWLRGFAYLTVCVPAALTVSLFTNFGSGRLNRWIADGLIAVSGILAWLLACYLMGGGEADVPAYLHWLVSGLSPADVGKALPWYVHGAFLLPVPVYFYVSPFIGFYKKPWQVNAAWVVCAFLTELPVIGLLHLVR